MVRSTSAYVSVALVLTAGCGGTVSVDDETAAAGGAGAVGTSTGPSDPSGATGPDDVTSAGAGASGGSGTTGSGGAPAVHFCYRLVDSNYVERFDLENGGTDVIGFVPPDFARGGLPHPPASASDAVYDCSVGYLWRSDLSSATMSGAGIPCTAVAVDDDGAGLVVATEDQLLVRYASWDDALRDNGETYALPGYPVDVLGLQGGVVYFAAGFAGSVQRFSLSDGADIGPLLPEGLSGPLEGIDVTPDGLLLVDDGAGGLRVLDAETGASLFEVSIPSGATQGLTCETVVPL